jgi:RNA:NAD 2'-phosphotransferase (TPT1/KptA family)
VGVTPRDDVTVPLADIIAAMRKHDTKNRVVFIGRKYPSDVFWEVWKARAIDGHTILNLKNMTLSIKLTASHYDITPCIAHGTQIGVIHSILPCGLRRMGRQCVMFSAFPHWDRRIGHGQRSGTGQWTAVVFLSKGRALRGSEARHLRPLHQ